MLELLPIMTHTHFSRDEYAIKWVYSEMCMPLNTSKSPRNGLLRDSLKTVFTSKVMEDSR